MQEDFCPPNGALAVAGGRQIASPINKLLSMPFTLRIATRDWHPPDHVSFATSHPPPHNTAFESQVTIANPVDSSQTTAIPIWPAHCVQGTPGAELIPELDTSKLDSIIDKGRTKDVEMFSAFADAFGNKSSDAASFGLAAFLQEKAVSKVFVVGLTGDYCVRCTAIDARKEGFEVYVVEEAVESIEKGAKGWEGVRADFDERGISVISIDRPELQDIKLSE
ncbi:MAG: hypothetical protein Q9181_005674 [Wetmoreana brouardii]